MIKTIIKLFLTGIGIGLIFAYADFALPGYYSIIGWAMALSGGAWLFNTK